MSCATNALVVSTKPARLGSGIARLTSKQAFFAGMAVGASGTGLGAMLVSGRQRLANLFGRKQSPRQAAVGPSKSSSSSGSSRAKAKPIPALAAGRQAKPIPGVAKSGQKKTIPVLATPDTTLQAASVQMQTNTGQPFVAQNSYRVLQADGTNSGLALTPYLAQNKGQAVPQKGAWSVTHAGSGALIDGPHPNLKQAQGLASKLSTLPWTGSLSKADITQAKRIIKNYRPSE